MVKPNAGNPFALSYILFCDWLIQPMNKMMEHTVTRFVYKQTEVSKYANESKNRIKTLVFESTRIIKVVVLETSQRGGEGGGYKREGKGKWGEINK